MGSFVDTGSKLKCQDDVERKLAALIAKDGVRIKQFFIDFDKLRKGYCGEAAFRTCFGTLKITLTEAETQGLLKKYASAAGVGLVDYARFCDKLNEVFMDHVNP
jgi:Ca2+-binding EF-hand superfamily protein